MLSDLRVNQWIAHLPEDHPLAQQHTSLLQATNLITWTSAYSRQLAVSNGLRILLVRGYDSLHHIKDDDLKLLAVRWSKGTDALDAALCSLGVFSRTPKRGSARHGRRQRMTASELVENADVPDRFRHVVDAEKVLVAVGRKPYLTGLNLDNIGISPDPATGRLTVDNKYKTVCHGVYAIGDVIAGPMLAHKASAEGIAAVECIAGKAGSVNYNAVPSVVYSSPEVASVGLSEEVLNTQRIVYKTGTFFFKANGRALAMDSTDGFVKIFSDATSDRVLGVQIIGQEASELIAQAVTVIEFGGSAEDMALMSQAHPTLSEAVKEAALDVAKISIHGPPAREH